MALFFYTFEKNGGSFSDWSTLDLEEARSYARNFGLTIVENRYEWADSEPIQSDEPDEEDDNGND